MTFGRIMGVVSAFYRVPFDAVGDMPVSMILASFRMVADVMPHVEPLASGSKPKTITTAEEAAALFAAFG